MNTTYIWSSGQRDFRKSNILHGSELSNRQQNVLILIDNRRNINQSSVVSKVASKDKN